MKYYADYWNECIYSIKPNGEGICKYMDVKIPKEVKIKRQNDEPWMWEENGVGDLIEDMTKEEFDSFGKTWTWNNFPNENEKIKHSWRNYIRPK